MLPTGIVPRQGGILWEHDNGMDLNLARQLIGSGKMLLAIDLVCAIVSRVSTGGGVGGISLLQDLVLLLYYIFSFFWMRVAQGCVHEGLDLGVHMVAAVGRAIGQRLFGGDED